MTFSNPLNLKPVNQIQPVHSKEFLDNLNQNKGDDKDTIFICECGSKLTNIKSCTFITHLKTVKHHTYLWKKSNQI